MASQLQLCRASFSSSLALSAFSLSKILNLILFTLYATENELGRFDRSEKSQDEIPTRALGTEQAKRERMGAFLLQISDFFSFVCKPIARSPSLLSAICQSFANCRAPFLPGFFRDPTFRFFAIFHCRAFVCFRWRLLVHVRGSQTSHAIGIPGLQGFSPDRGLCVVT